MMRLKTYSYSGNIRELKNLLERAVIECDGSRIHEQHLHFFYPDVTKRADKVICEPPENQTVEENQNDESVVINYLKEQGLINNTVCRQLLNVDRHRSSYFLRKLEKQGLLISEGQGRWAQYRLRN